MCYVFVKSIAEKYSYTREKSSIGVFGCAGVILTHEIPGPNSGALERLATTHCIQYMICYPRSSRKDSRSYTDSRRLSIRSTNGKDYTHCTCENVLEEDIFCISSLTPVVVFETTCRIATTRRISSSFGYDRFRTLAYNKYPFYILYTMDIFLVPDTGFPPVTPALQGRYSEWAELIRLISAFGGT